MQEKSIGLYLFSAQFAKTRWRYRCKCLHSKTKLKFFLNHLFEARAHLSKNIRAVHSWVADNLKICLQLITGKNFRDENESYEDVEEFNHDDFLELGFNANHIGRLIAKIKMIAVDYGNLDIVSIVDSAGTKKMILGTIPFEESKNMDDTILAAKLQQNIEMAKRENYYAPVTAMLIPLLDSFLEILQAALFAMDQTSLGFGGCGLNYASVGIDSVPLVYDSDQPRLCSSVIIGQIGARKLAPAIVFPTQSKDPVRNAEIIRELYNDTDAILCPRPDRNGGTGSDKLGVSPLVGGSPPTQPTPQRRDKNNTKLRTILFKNGQSQAESASPSWGSKPLSPG